MKKVAKETFEIATGSEQILFICDQPAHRLWQKPQVKMKRLLVHK